MSRKERDRLKVMAALEAGRVKQVEAARLLRLNVRQVRRIQGRYPPRKGALSRMARWVRRPTAQERKWRCSVSTRPEGP